MTAVEIGAVVVVIFAIAIVGSVFNLARQFISETKKGQLDPDFVNLSVAHKDLDGVHSNPEMVTLWNTGRDNPETLSDHDKAMYFKLMGILIQGIDNALGGSGGGDGQELSEERMTALKRVLGSAGGQAWLATDHFEFSELVKGLIEDL
jgi:hypothetical protein